MSSTEHITTNQTGSISDPPDNRLRTREGKQRQGLSWWQASAAGAVAAAVGNLVIFLIGLAAGASFVVMDRGDLHEVTAGAVIVATVPPLVARSPPVGAGRRRDARAAHRGGTSDG